MSAPDKLMIDRKEYEQLLATRNALMRDNQTLEDSVTHFKKAWEDQKNENESLKREIDFLDAEIAKSRRTEKGGIYLEELEKKYNLSNKDSDNG